MTCDRCGRESIAQIMSMFNTETICLDCKVKEKAHPSYQRACAEEAAALKAGVKNYSGIGKPADL